jgi:hypothetical protein
VILCVVLEGMGCDPLPLPAENCVPAYTCPPSLTAPTPACAHLPACLPTQICCSFGVDVLEALAASCTQVAAGWSRRAAFNLACDVTVASLLLVLHGATMMSQVGQGWGVALGRRAVHASQGSTQHSWVIQNKCRRTG